MYLLYILQSAYNSENQKFLADPETFGLKLLVSVPVSQNLNFLVSFWYPLWSNLGLPGFVPVPEKTFGLFLSYYSVSKNHPFPSTAECLQNLY